MFDLADFELLERVISPETLSYELQYGVMFNVTPKEYKVVIRQLGVPFVLGGGNMNISIHTLDRGFWYKKYNEAAWDHAGSSSAHSPGMTLDYPMPLSQRGSQNYG